MDWAVVEEFLLLLLENGGEMELNYAVSKLSPRSSQLVNFQFVKRLPQLFTTRKQSKSKLFVKIDLPLEFCPRAGDKGGCGLRNCTQLHLCPFSIKGSCSYGLKCRRSHDCVDEHTCRVLTPFKLGFLLRNPGLLKRVLNTVVVGGEIQQAASSRSVPDVCKFYNKASECKKGDNCPFLHVCEHHIDGDCKFGGRCKRQHVLTDPHNKKVLKEFGIAGLSERAVLQLLKGRERKRTLSGSSDSEKPVYDQPLPTAIRAVDISDQPSVKVDKGKDTEICGFHLRGKCNYGNSCINRHTELPYLWEYANDGDDSWESFSSDLNMMVEVAFCDAKIEGTVVPIKGTMYHLKFQDMSAVKVDNFKKLMIRRLSTVSSVSAPAGHVFSTRWQWYWQDENDKWQSYDTPDDGVTPNTTSSQCLERDYVSGKESHPFSASHHKYTLYFKEWFQQNDKHKTKRPVRRRPELVSKQNMKDVAQRRRATGVTASTSSALAQPDSLPPHWTKLPSGEDYQCVQLQTISEEYKRTEQKFQETMDGDHRIIKIERVQNPDLWTLFTQRKGFMSKKAGKEPEERQLFHGTNSSIVNAICQQGFDWRLCGKHGTSFGKGSYFACKANYSHRYSNKQTGGAHNQMFLAKVLVGSYTVGNSSMSRPPSRDPLNPHLLHDSCCDNSSNPAIFVVFENGQSYPEFLITYV